MILTACKDILYLHLPVNLTILSKFGMLQEILSHFAQTRVRVASPVATVADPAAVTCSGPSRGGASDFCSLYSVLCSLSSVCGTALRHWNQQYLTEQLHHFILFLQTPVFNREQHLGGNCLAPEPIIQFFGGR